MPAKLIAALILWLVILMPASAQGACSQTLQSRVDQAAAGSTLLVPPCTYRETVNIMKPLTLDGQNKAIVDGDGTRIRWFWIGASDVTVKNFILRNTNTPSQIGAVATAAGIRNVVIDHNVMSNTRDGQPIAIGGTTNSKVTNNDLSGGGQMGIATWRNVNLLIQGNHVHHNNQLGLVDPYWAAGGIKAVQDAGLQVLNNEVHHNVGPGIWIDILATDVVIANNNVHDQTWNPIFFETSSRGEIHSNTVSASNQGEGNWGCITVSSSADVNVHDNTCTDTLPLRIQLDNRADVPANAGRNNVVRDNRLTRPVPNQATSWWQFSPTGPLIPGQNGNLDVNNVIVTNNPPTPTPVACEVKVKLGGVEGPWLPCR